MKEDTAVKVIAWFFFVVLAFLFVLSIVGFGAAAADTRSSGLDFHILASIFTTTGTIIFLVMRTIYRNNLKQSYYEGQDNGLKIAYKQIKK